VGDAIAVTEVADDGGIPLPTPVESAPTSVIEPAPAENTAAPSIVGAAVQQGQTLTDRHGSWTNLTASTTYTYQWEECDSTGANCAPISGATDQTYTPTIADVGDTLEVQETASNGGLPVSGAATSVPSSVVLPTAPSNFSPPTIAGEVEQGQPLTENAGTWSSGVDAPTSYSYQWESCNASGANCAAISGATTTTYTPATADVGNAIVVLETATNSGGSTTAASVATAPAAPAPAPAIEPTTTAAKSVGPESGTLEAKLQTQGLAVTWQFEYGTNTKYANGTLVTSVAAGGANVLSVSSPLGNLKPSTKYHYRIVESIPATQYAPAVTAYGVDRTFTTSTIGKVLLASSTLHVTGNKVQVPIKCDSLLACVDRFSLSTSAQVGTGKHVGTVGCATVLTTISANKTKEVTVKLNAACKSLLDSATDHRLAATFSTRPRSGQAGEIKNVKLVEPGTKKSKKAAVRRA
jgi:hypothetical protein